MREMYSPTMARLCSEPHAICIQKRKQTQNVKESCSSHWIYRMRTTVYKSPGVPLLKIFLCVLIAKKFICVHKMCNFTMRDFFWGGGVKLALHYSKAVYTLPESHDTESVMKILTQNFRFLYHCKDM